MPQLQALQQAPLMQHGQSTSTPSGGNPSQGGDSSAPAGDKKKGPPKKLPGKVVCNHGSTANFPPAPSSSGARYFVAQSTVTGEARIFCGAAALHAKLLSGRSLQEIKDEEVVGFHDLEPAVAYFFEQNSRCSTVVM